MSLLFDISQLEANLDTLLAYTYPPVNLAPSLIITEKLARAHHKSALESVLLDLSATRVAVQSIQVKLTRLEVDLRLKEASVKGAISPVSSLPTEVLREILEIVIRQSIFQSQTARRLSHVSTEWRSVALETRTLWEQVVITPNGADSFGVLAARSGHLPISVTLNPIRAGSLNIAREHASRIEQLVFIGEQTYPQIQGLDAVASHLKLDGVSFTSDQGSSTRSTPVVSIHPGITSTKSLHSNGSLFHNIDALVLPRLEHFTLERLSNRDVSDSLLSLRTSHFKTLYLDEIQSEPSVMGLVPLDAGGVEARIESLHLSYSMFPIFSTICQTWEMNNLTSLAIHEILHVSTDHAQTDSERLFMILVRVLSSLLSGGRRVG